MRRLLPLTLFCSFSAFAADNTDWYNPTAKVPDAPVEITVRSGAANPARPDLGLKLNPYNINNLDFRFPSGLRVIFQPDHTEPIVAITAVVAHGASDDPIGKEGIAHLIEHLWFRSVHGDAPKVWDLLETEMGCDLNAFTQYDITAYMSVCAAQNLDAMLKLESLRISAPVEGVTQDMVKTEIEVVRNEIRMRGENYNIPFFTVWEFVNRHMFPEGHPYHRAMAGDHTSIRNIVVQDAQEWTAKYYKPENTTIVVVGDLPGDSAIAMLDLLVRNFDLTLLDKDLKPEHIRQMERPGGGTYVVPIDPRNPNQLLPVTVELESRNAPFRDAVTPEAADKNLAIYEGPVKKPTLAVSWPIPAAYQGQDTNMEIAGALLSSVVSFGLDQIDDPHVAEFGGCGALLSQEVSTMVCSIELADIDAKQEQKTRSIANAVTDHVIDQIANLFNTDDRSFIDMQFSMARQQILAQIFNSTDLFSAVGSGRATDTATYANFTGNTRYFTDKMKEALGLNTEDLIHFTTTFLKRDRATSTLILPIKRDEVAIASEDTDGSGGHFHGGGTASILHPSFDLDKVTPELIEETVSLPSTVGMIDVKLPTGLRVVIRKHGEVPLVQAQLIAGGGTLNDLDEMGTFANAFTLDDGDVRAGNGMMAPIEPLRIAGGWLNDTTDLSEIKGIRASSANLDAALWMLRQRVSTMRPYLSGKNTWIKRRESSIKKNWRDIDWAIADIRREHLNPGHPLNDQMTWADVQALKKAKPSDVAAELYRTWQPANTTLLIVGDVDPLKALEQVRVYFGGWRAQPGVTPAAQPAVPGPNPAKDQKIYVFDDKGKTQTQVTLVCPLQPAMEQPSPAHQLLGDVASLTLFSELREQAGVVYSPGAAAFTQPGGSAFMYMTAAIQNDSAAFAMERYLAFLDRAAHGQLSDSDLRLKKRAKALNYVLHQQSIDQMSDRLLGIIERGQTWSSLERYREALANVDVQALADITQGCAEHAFIAFKGPKDKVIAQLEERGLPYELVDWKARGEELWREADPKGFAKHKKEEAREKAKKAKKGTSGDDADDDEDDDDES